MQWEKLSEGAFYVTCTVSSFNAQPFTDSQRLNLVGSLACGKNFTATYTFMPVTP
jgi:hypothetical protein